MRTKADMDWILREMNNAERVGYIAGLEKALEIANDATSRSTIYRDLKLEIKKAKKESEK